MKSGREAVLRYRAVSTGWAARRWRPRSGHARACWAWRRGPPRRAPCCAPAWPPSVPTDSRAPPAANAWSKGRVKASARPSKSSAGMQKQHQATLTRQKGNACMQSLQQGCRTVGGTGGAAPTSGSGMTCRMGPPRSLALPAGSGPGAAGAVAACWYTTACGKLGSSTCRLSRRPCAASASCRATHTKDTPSQRASPLHECLLCPANCLPA